MKQNVPKWHRKALNEDRIWFRLEGNPRDMEYGLDGRWMLIGDGGAVRPSVVSNELFQAGYEPCKPAYSVGGYVQNPTSPWVIKDGRVFLKEDVKVADLLKELR